MAAPFSRFRQFAVTPLAPFRLSPALPRVTHLRALRMGLLWGLVWGHSPGVSVVSAGASSLGEV